MQHSTTGSTTSDRARGALLGLAWGDALGCPVEGWRASEIVQHFGNYRDLPESYPASVSTLRDDRWRRLRPLGLHSDDTQQAVALLATCLRSGGFALGHWVCWLLAGESCGAWRGVGRNFKAALKKMRSGEDPESAGSRSAGIGAAMRVGPVGALLRAHPEALEHAVVQSSLITHGDLRAAAIAFAVARTVAWLVDGVGVDAVAAQLPEEVARVEQRWSQAPSRWRVERSGAAQVSASLRVLLDPSQALRFGEQPELLRERVSELARPYLGPGFRRAHPNQGFALLGGAHALGMALLCHAPPQQVLGEIVRQGFDTDTVAAICGSLLGARHGHHWVPVHRLVDGPVLARWANALLPGQHPPEDRDTFFRREAERTRQEQAFGQALVEMRASTSH